MASYSNPVPVVDNGAVEWWIILLAVLGGLLVIGSVIALIVYKRKNRRFKY